MAFRIFQFGSLVVLTLAVEPVPSGFVPVSLIYSALLPAPPTPCGHQEGEWTGDMLQRTPRSCHDNGHLVSTTMPMERQCEETQIYQ